MQKGCIPFFCSILYALEPLISGTHFWKCWLKGIDAVNLFLYRWGSSVSMQMLPNLKASAGQEGFFSQWMDQLISGRTWASGLRQTLPLTPQSSSSQNSKITKCHFNPVLTFQQLLKRSQKHFTLALVFDQVPFFWISHS